MRCLTHEESATWCRKHRYPAVDVGKFGRPVPSVREQFMWDCHVFTDDGRRVFFCSHDEWCGMFLPDMSSVDDLLEELSPGSPLDDWRK
jgi:hypothetical protein